MGVTVRHNFGKPAKQFSELDIGATYVFASHPDQGVYAKQPLFTDSAGSVWNSTSLVTGQRNYTGLITLCIEVDVKMHVTLKGEEPAWSTTA